VAERNAFHLRRHSPVQMVAAASIFAAIVGAIGLSFADTSPNEAAETQVITIENMQFSPAELTVKRGTRIVWKNQDMFPHTATAKAAFDSGSIDANASWTYVAGEPGDYVYICTYHPTMKGRLIVR